LNTKELSTKIIVLV